MDKYVEKMIKDKFLLEIITTAFYDNGTPVEVLYPDLDCSYDLILSCNGFTQLIAITCIPDLPVTPLLRIPNFEFAGIDLPLAMAFSRNENPQDIFKITLVVSDRLEILRRKVGSSEKRIQELLFDLFGLEVRPILSMFKYKYEQSTLMEQFGTRTFIKDIRETAWLKFGKKEIMVLRGEVDAFGYDLVLICDKKIRHIQLKLSNSPDQPVNIKLALKTGGCVVWQRANKNTKAWDCDYYFLGGKPDECLNFLWVCKAKRSRQQENREEIKQIKKDIKELEDKIDDPALPLPDKADLENKLKELLGEKTDLENNRKTKFNISKRVVKLSYLCDLSKSCEPIPISCRLLDSLKITCMIGREIMEQGLKEPDDQINVLDIYKVGKLKNKTIYQKDKDDPQDKMINLINILFDLPYTGTL